MNLWGRRIFDEEDKNRIQAEYDLLETICLDVIIRKTGS